MDTLASVYWSEEWPLAGPGNQTGEAVYQPQLEGHISFPVEAFKVRCAYVFVSKVQHSAAADFRLKPAAGSSSVNVSLGEASQTAGSVTVFEAAAPIDPRVEISLLQGSALLRHLQELSLAFAIQAPRPLVQPSTLQAAVEKAEAALESQRMRLRKRGLGRQGQSEINETNPVRRMRELADWIEAERIASEASASGHFLEMLSGAAATYFAGAPLPDRGSPFACLLDPARPLRIEVGAPQSDDLRAAFSVVVRDLEGGYTTITDPVFLTSVHGQVIATDLPVELVSDIAMSDLKAAADAGGDIASLAQSLGRSKVETWYHLVRATQELGAASVDEAIDFAAYATESGFAPALT